MKRIVAERPETSFFSVDVDTRFTHGTVKEQCHFFVGRGVKTGTIPSGTYIRKTAGTSCLQGSFFLKVLCHCYVLEVIVHVEWTKNRPVVWNNNRFPFSVIELRLTGLFKISFTEFPVLLQQCLTALRLHSAGGGHQKYS